MKKTDENKNKAVRVFIPKTSKNDDSLYVAVNGRRMLIKKGVEAEVPPAFAEVIANSGAAAEEADRFISSVAAE